MLSRQGEPKANHFRSGRVFYSGNSWYFATREQIDMGPFQTKQEADDELSRFILYIVHGGEYAHEYLKMA